jgi:lysophospholipase L1-like esterase
MLKNATHCFPRGLIYVISFILYFNICAESACPESSQQSALSQSAATSLAEKPPDNLTAPPIDRFELAIKRFEWKDRHWPPHQGAVVFVGSSTFTKWRTLELTFREFRAINRGFGGATIPEVNHYVDRIVTNYKPSKVVFYCGSNDIAELHHDGEQVFADFKTFVKLVHESLPECQIYFISESAAPCREGFESEFSKCNSLTLAFIKSTPYVHYIDVLPVMRDKNGTLRVGLFGPDHLHMNLAGYALWTPIIKAALKSGK